MIDTITIIRTLVAKSGLSIMELSIEINASEKSIYKWLSGKTKPNCEHLLALIDLVLKNDGKDI